MLRDCKEGTEWEGGEKKMRQKSNCFWGNKIFFILICFCKMGMQYIQVKEGNHIRNCP